MEMRGAFMRPPRERGGLMRPLGPLRGRGVMGMERMRLGPPLRPGLIRGGPPVPFVGRGMVLPPHARPRGMGPVMLPRPHIPPPGPMGPLGPRGMLPRPMLPPRPMGMDVGNLNELPLNPQIPVNGSLKGGNNQLKMVKESGVANKSAPAAGQNEQLVNRVVNRNIKPTNRVNKGNQNAGQVGGLKKNRKDIKNRRQGNLSQPLQQLQPHQQMQIPTQPPVQNMHPSQHRPQLSLPQQNNIGANSAQPQKHLHPIPPQMSTGVLQPPQPHPIHHQPSMRGGRNGMNPRNRNPNATNRAGLINTVQSGPANRGNMYVNRGGPNISSRNPSAPVPSRGPTMMSGPPPSALYSSASPASYAVASPNVAPQMPMKRGGPPMNAPPVMQPKRVRYDAPLPPSNGYAPYQQQPPPHQSMYSYDVPPPVEVYNNAPPPAVSMQPSLNYGNADYNNYSSVPQNNAPYSNAPAYSSYNSAPAYSSYSNTADYDTNEYSVIGSQPTNSVGEEAYGYNKIAPPVDPYAYSNQTYSNQQTGYDDYNSGYMEVGGYGAPVQDPTYGQSVGTYGSYSY